MSVWPIYRKDSEPHDDIDKLPPPPPWRSFTGIVSDNYQHIYDLLTTNDKQNPTWRRTHFAATDEEIRLINAALFLRRPLLVTGKPGTGKSTVAFAVAHQLKLGPVLVWPINSRSNIQDALYHYDAIGHLQAVRLRHESIATKKTDLHSEIGNYIRLGALGTALLPTKRPRVLLIDEIDKSDIDLPNDLLHIFEEGEFRIPELVRLQVNQSKDNKNDLQQSAPTMVHTDDGLTQAAIWNGRVMCKEFPLVVMTSNGERELPPPFLRRCIRLAIKPPSFDKLARIVREYFAGDEKFDRIIQEFLKRRDGEQNSDSKSIATDQLLNLIYLLTSGVDVEARTPEKRTLIDDILRELIGT
jgi:MoxR-like ATPase